MAGRWHANQIDKGSVRNVERNEVIKVLYILFNIIIDYIVKLLRLKDPVTGDIFNSIIVIIDKLTKYTIIVPFKELYKAD